MEMRSLSRCVPTGGKRFRSALKNTQLDKKIYSGTKEQKKIYQKYIGFRAGRRTMTAAKVREREPERMIVQAVTGMLPGNHLCQRMLKRLKVFVGPEHTHAAQKPVKVELV